MPNPVTLYPALGAVAATYFNVAGNFIDNPEVSLPANIFLGYYTVAYIYGGDSPKYTINKVWGATTIAFLGSSLLNLGLSLDPTTLQALWVLIGFGSLDVIGAAFSFSGI